MRHCRGPPSTATAIRIHGYKGSFDGPLQTPDNCGRVATAVCRCSGIRENSIDRHNGCPAEFSRIPLLLAV
jgi:hypothetical protein